MKESNLASTFSLERVFLYGKRFLYVNKKSLITSFSSFIILFLAFIIWSELTQMDEISYQIMTRTLLYIFTFMGYYLTSFMFDESNSPNTDSQFLTLPVSSKERYLFSWFFSYVLIFSFIGALTLIISYMSDSKLSELMWSSSTNILLEITLLHSIFFYGAIYFKQNSFTSTFISVIIISTVLTLIVLYLKSFISTGELPFLNGTFVSEFFSTRIFGYLVAITFWFLTYRRLLTKQAA